MGKFIEVSKITPSLLGYEIKNNKIIKIYDNGDKISLKYSIENEIDCLYELRSDIPNVKNYIQSNIDSLKNDLIFLNSYFGASLYSALYYADNKTIPSALLSGTLGVLALRRLKNCVQDISLKNLASRGDMKIYYRNRLVKNSNKLEEQTVCELVYAPDEENIEYKNICELKKIREQLYTSKKEIEEELHLYDENDTFEKVYEMH